MWKGVISFGMVSIPIRLYVATESHSVSFHQLCPEHHARIKYRRWCPVGEHEVNYCPSCQTEGRLLADRSLSRLLKSDWPRTLDELERRRGKLRQTE